jgi:hypothetical protein
MTARAPTMALPPSYPATVARAGSDHAPRAPRGVSHAPRYQMSLPTPLGEFLTPSIRFPLLPKGNRCLVPPPAGGTCRSKGIEKSSPLLPYTRS